MKKNSFLVLSLLSVVALGVGAAITSIGQNTLNLRADENHAWNHYAAKTPTEASAGNKEFWVCCVHHEVSLTLPETGTIVEATNPNFASVEAGTEFNAAYLAKVSTNTFNIGYEKMSKTGAQEESWEHIEGFDDVVQGISVKSLAKDSYGASAGNKKVGDDAGNAAKDGALMYSVDSEYGISLPRFNFALYEYVKVSYGIDTWNASTLAAQFGTNDDKDNLHAQSTEKYGVLTFEMEDSKLKVTDVSGSATKSIYITDAKIIDGSKPFHFSGASVDLNRTFYCNDIYIKTSTHTHNVGAYVPALDRFGRKVGTCSCGETVFAPGDDVTTFDSPSKFDAGGSFLSYHPTGKWEPTSPTSGTISYGYGNPVMAAITLPKVDFITAGSTVFKFSTTLTAGSSATDRFSLKYGTVVLHEKTNYGDNYTFGFKVVYDADNKNAVLTSYVSNGTTYGPAIITDTSVLNGDSSLSLTMETETNYNCIGLNTILIGHDCDKCEHVKTPRTDKIGLMPVSCKVCLAPCENEIMTDKDFDLTETNKIGATGWDVVGAGTSWGPPGSDSRNCLTNAMQDLAQEDSTLPKIDYSVYEKVEFEIRTNNVGSNYIGIGINNYGDLIPCTQHGEYEYGTIKVTCAEDKQTLTITYTSKVVDLTATQTLVNANVATGVSGLTLKASQNGAYRNYVINRFAFNHDKCDKLGSTAALDVIGYKDAICSTCGERTGSKSTEVMTTSDINLKTTTYGASISTEETSSDIRLVQDGGKIKYYCGVQGKANTEYGLNMPKINFSLYSEVSMTIKMASGWLALGVDSSHWAQTGVDGTTAIVTVTNNGDDTLTVAMNWTVDSDSSKIGSWSITVSDANVINGTNSLQLYAKDPFGNKNRVYTLDSIAVTLPTA